MGDAVGVAVVGAVVGAIEDVGSSDGTEVGALVGYLDARCFVGEKGTVDDPLVLPGEIALGFRMLTIGDIVGVTVVFWNAATGENVGPE